MLNILQAIYPVDQAGQPRSRTILQALRQHRAADLGLNLLRRIRRRPRRQFDGRQWECGRIRLSREERDETGARFEWV